MKISFGNYIKKYLSVFLIIFIIFSCFGFIGVSAMANDIPIQITENEIKQFKNKDSTLSLQLLYNLMDEPEYIMAYNDLGYEIYSRVSGTLLESNKSAENPYRNIKKGYYLSALSYADGSLQDLREIKTGRSFSNSEKKLFRENQKRMKQKAKEHRKAQALNTSVDSSVNLDYRDVQYSFTLTQVDNFNNVESPLILKRLTGGYLMGVNSAGSCSVIAMNIIYQYNNVKYGGITPYVAPQHWIDACNGHVVTGSDGDAYNCTLLLPSNNFTVVENMHRYLIKLSGASSLGINNAQIETMVDAYNTELMDLGCHDALFLEYAQSSVQKVYNNVNTAINFFRIPTKLSIYTGSNGHAVVAYGTYYDSSINKYYFRIHGGHINYSDVVISDDFLKISNSIYSHSIWIAPNSNHSLTKVDDNYHTCSNPSCYAVNNYHGYFVKNATTHICACGYEKQHNFINITGNEGHVSNVTYPSSATKYCTTCYYFE